MTLRARLRADHMVRNSLLLILNSGLQAALGFVFWLIAARLFSTANVGRATSLISAATLIAFIALLGLNSAFLRYLPTAPDKDTLMTAGVALVAFCGGLIGLVYVLLTPVIAPQLAFVDHQPLQAAGFVALTAAGGVNLLTDSIFVSYRRAGYNALVDGGVAGVAKVASGLLLAGTSAYGLFCASAMGYVAATIGSLILMRTALHWRPSLRQPVRALRPLLGFSGASSAGNILNLLPSLVVPVIVLDRLGPSSAAFYFVAFQIATLLYAAAYSLEQAFMAEGSYGEEEWHSLLRRSARVLTVLCVPAFLVLVVSAHWLLLIFGKQYSKYGTEPLMLLALAALPLAANNWLLTVLRLSGRLKVIVVSSTVYAVAIIGGAWLLAPRGLVALVAAWPLGGMLGAAVAAGPVWAQLRRRSPRATSAGVPASSELFDPVSSTGRALIEALVEDADATLAKEGLTSTASSAVIGGPGRPPTMTASLHLETDKTRGLPEIPMRTEGSVPAGIRKVNGGLNVLIVSAYAEPHIGGVEVVVSQQAATLAALGHQVTVVTSACGADRGRSEEPAGYSVVRVAAWNGLENRLGVPYPLWRPAGLVRLVGLIRKADVVHVHDVYYASSIVAATMAFGLGRPTFITQHVALVEHDRAVVKLVQKVVYTTAGRMLWNRAIKITAYNPIVKQFLCDHGVAADKVILTANGIDTGEFAPGDGARRQATRRRYGLSLSKPIVLFVGRLVPKKGLDRLLEASGSEYEIVLAGSGQIPEDVPAGVKFLGPVARSDLRDIYQASDIFAFPAVGEMFTLAMQEAMACGLPIVATAEAGYADYDLDRSAIALIDPEPQILRATFLGILRNPQRAARMSRYSRSLAEERFDWRHNATRLASDYVASVSPPRPAVAADHVASASRPRPSVAADYLPPQPPNTPAAAAKPTRHRALWPVAVAATVAAIGISLLVPAGRHQWALSLVRQPTAYTSLSFNQPASLPTAVTNKPLPLSFTVANREGHAVTYRYVINTSSNAGPQVVGVSSRTIPAGATWSVSTQIRPRCASSPCRIEVALPGHPETIDFVADVVGPGSAQG